MISSAEWEIMRVVWAEGQLTSRQIIDTMLAISEWKEGTVKSMLNRLTKKGILTQDTTVSPFLYSSSISMKEATLTRTDDIMANSCNLDHAGIIAHMIENNTFSQTQLQDLVSLLQVKMQTAPANITCQCTPGQCHCHVSQTSHTKEKELIV